MICNKNKKNSLVTGHDLGKNKVGEGARKAQVMG